MGDDGIILLICIAIILVLLIVITMSEIKAKTGKKAKEETDKNYLELQEAYRQISTIQKELCIKYEESKRSEEKAKKLAFSDYLTGLPNRTAFTEMLENVMLTLRKEESVAIMYIDLDNFKYINDSLGHSYGDELLIDVAERVKQLLDENDYLARFGGDEFILLTQNIEDVGLYEEKIKKVEKVFSYPFVLSMREFFITTSIGVTFAPRDGKTTQNLVKNVDLAMYEAKKIGKNTYCFYDEQMNSKRMEQIELQSELRSAIEEKEFEVYYQPHMDISLGKVVGFEALLRWKHPVKGILLPGQFLALAEETGLILPIGSFVLDRAISSLKEWHDKGFSALTMAVNLSARQFKEEELVSRIEDTLVKYEILPEYLELEITEKTAMEDLNFAIDKIEVLKEKGIKFTLDNFGSGYSSMNYLKFLPMDHIKLDKSFVEKIAGNERERNMASGLISLLHALPRKVTAKGVEGIEQARVLEMLDCDRAQGFLYGEPMEKEAVQSLLEEIGC